MFPCWWGCFFCFVLFFAIRNLRVKFGTCLSLAGAQHITASVALTRLTPAWALLSQPLFLLRTSSLAHLVRACPPVPAGLHYWGFPGALLPALLQARPGNASASLGLDLLLYPGAALRARIFQPFQPSATGLLCSGNNNKKSFMGSFETYLENRFQQGRFFFCLCQTLRGATGLRKLDQIPS